MHKQRLDFVKALALEAGQLTLEGFGQCGQMPKDSQDGYDIATEYDLKTEDLVKKRILEEFGEPVLGEEDGLIGDPAAARRKLWIVDPVDGTFNYQRGLPLYGVSIAYCENGIPTCGAVFFPALDQLFFAAEGSGAFLAQGDERSPQPIQVSQERRDVRLIIGVSGKDSYRLIAAFAAEEILWRSLRYAMCAVADLAFIAVGRMDAYCHTALNLWDCAAADIILREAGGPGCYDFGGIPIFPEYVNRWLDNHDAGPFTFMAASSRELFEEPLKRIVASAGYQVEG